MSNFFLCFTYQNQISNLFFDLHYKVAIVYPLVMADFEAWRDAQDAPFVVLESAIILSKPIFDGIADYVVAVTAEEEVRLSRLISRGLTEEDARRRISAQTLDLSKADVIIENDGSLDELAQKCDSLFTFEGRVR